MADKQPAESAPVHAGRPRPAEMTLILVVVQDALINALLGKAWRRPASEHNTAAPEVGRQEPVS